MSENVKDETLKILHDWGAFFVETGHSLWNLEVQIKINFPDEVVNHSDQFIRLLTENFYNRYFAFYSFSPPDNSLPGLKPPHESTEDSLDDMIGGYMATFADVNHYRKHKELKFRKIPAKSIVKFRKYMPDDLFKDFMSNISNPDYFEVAETYCLAMALYCQTLIEKPGADYLRVIRLMYKRGILVIDLVHTFYGYWYAKLERKLSTKPASKAKKKKTRGRIDKLKEEVEKTGEPFSKGYRISRKAWEQFFTEELEIYTEPSKRKYKKEVEKLLTAEKSKKQIIEIIK
jgi:hypothetical protein